MVFNIVIAVIGALCLIGFVLIQESGQKHKKNLNNVLKPFGVDHKSEVNGTLIAVSESDEVFYHVASDMELTKIPFSKIISSELKVDDQTVQGVSLKGAAAGAIIAGGIGAVIGAKSKQKKKVKSIVVDITVNNLMNPNIKLWFYNGHEPELNMSMKSSEKWQSIFKVIIERNKVDTKDLV